jgi:hypothetical protein
MEKKPSEKLAFGLNLCLPKILAWKGIEAPADAKTIMQPNKCLREMQSTTLNLERVVSGGCFGGKSKGRQIFESGQMK